MNKTEKAPHTVPAVSKALEIINLLAFSPNGETRNALAEKLDIAPSTCYRILRTLLEYSWIEKNAEGEYLLSTGLVPVSERLAKNGAVFRNAQKILDELSAATRLSCKLSIRRGLEQYTLARAESPGPIGVSGRVGAVFPLAEGSVGAALLALSDDAEIQKAAMSSPCDIQEKIDPSIAVAAAHEAREKGYALNCCRNRWKIGAMSFPVIRGERVLCALTLLGLESDFKSNTAIKSYFAELKKASEKLICEQ